MKRQITFKDAEKNKVKVNIELTTRNGYLELSMTGEHGGGFGQCNDSIKPKNDAQKALLDLWEKYHLNGMNAGTEEQQAILKAYEQKHGKRLDYDGACQVLKDARKYTVKHPETKEPYKYGYGWIVKKLPSDIEAQIEKICQDIETAEKGEKIKDRELVEAYESEADIVFALFVDTFGSGDAEKALALGLNEGLTVREALEEITVNGNNVDCQGVDYLVGNDEEMDTEHDENLENYIDDCLLCEIKDETLKRYFDREAWKEDAKQDGRGHALNGYDGGEDTQEVEGETIYIYRR